MAFPITGRGGHHALILGWLEDSDTVRFFVLDSGVEDPTLDLANSMVDQVKKAGWDARLEQLEVHKQSQDCDSGRFVLLNLQHVIYVFEGNTPDAFPTALCQRKLKGRRLKRWHVRRAREDVQDLVLRIEKLDRFRTDDYGLCTYQESDGGPTTMWPARRLSKVEIGLAPYKRKTRQSQRISAWSGSDRVTLTFNTQEGHIFSSSIFNLRRR